MAFDLQAIAFICGIFLHLLLFCRGEWDRRAPAVVLAYSLLCTSVFAAFALDTSYSIVQCIVGTCKASLALVGGLCTSLVTYRLLFHPLRTFPGPLAARVSSFWVFREQWPDLRFYFKLRNIHDRYGDFVRIKPRELSICHPDAINDIHGPRNRIRKGEFYEQIHPAHSLQFTRDPNQHKHQRRYWDKAFQTKALQEYSPRIVKHYKILMGIFSTDGASSAPVDVSKLFMDLFFDVVSDLTFGESFNTLTTGERNPIIGEFLAYQQSVGFVILNMWMFHLLRSIPTVASRILYWMQWYASAVAKRNEMKDTSPDLYTYLSQSDTFDVDGIHEAQLAIIAGADTNAITVSNVCYLLCQYPEYQKKLYEELADLPVHENVIEDRHLLSQSCLLSLINETLRLYPPVPGGLQRVTPPDGATIAGRYVPGDMIVSTPTYALHRDSRVFVRPTEFIPERWTSRPELILRKDAFVPFSYGAYNCAGKPLAMMQLRMVIAMVIKKFELSFMLEREAEYERYIHDQADCFTLHLHPLPLILKERTVREQVAYNFTRQEGTES
ncbi:benzoate 4-monooxygenase [Macroventuria anomochaeta]|uniref:Benzoate 4-monooxygenase n=1 Tax=Macroventuria anomochaeta TaxID=301207 RepID=A0ACB6RNL8_9PLEO|nr:benzoate 4-monooxygenase [Macroventuria anomochaeta]KAF2622537.1 benzoate 4-monooxygenase [Macroventuria anomochaeta]